MKELSNYVVCRNGVNGVAVTGHLHLTLVVDLDERGWFKAHVEDQNDRTIFEFSNEDEETGWPSEDGLWLVENGFMRHGRDTDGLLDYLQSVGIAKPNATLRVEG